MEERIRKRLIQAAREKQTILYTQLNDECELGFNYNLIQDRDAVGELFGEVSGWENQNSRPLLSSLVRHKSGNFEQGDGFYKLCQELGYGEWYNLKNDPNFEIEQIKLCYEFWKDPRNNKNHKDDF